MDSLELEVKDKKKGHDHYFAMDEEERRIFAKALVEKLKNNTKDMSRTLDCMHGFDDIQPFVLGVMSGEISKTVSMLETVVEEDCDGDCENCPLSPANNEDFECEGCADDDDDDEDEDKKAESDCDSCEVPYDEDK